MTMKDKQTAVQWLIDKLPHSIETQFSEQIQEALQMEQEEIDHAWNDGFLEGIDGGVTAVAKEYMNRIFGGQDER
jgi:hypothetical protein